MPSDLPPIQWMLPKGFVQTPGITPLHCHIKDAYCDEYGCVPFVALDTRETEGERT